MSCVSHSGKLSNPDKGSWKPSIYSWLGGSAGDSPDLPLRSRVARGGCVGMASAARGLPAPGR